MRLKADSPTKNCTATDCTRPLRARGLCSSHYNAAHQPNRHPKKMVECAWCGVEVLKQPGGGRKYGYTCSDQCRTWLTFPYSNLPADHWALLLGKTSAWPRVAGMTDAGRAKHAAHAERTRSPLAIAVRDGNHSAVISVIKQDCTVTDDGCWEWQRRLDRGYAVIGLNIDGKKIYFQVHRLSLEAKHGKPLGKQPAHHTCANTCCVNPDHLQPVTHRENIAEMLQRNYFMARIKELESALNDIAPGHPILNEIGAP